MWPIDLRQLLEALSPTICPLCLGPGQAQLGLCEMCLNGLERNAIACQLCAVPGVNGVCGQCQQEASARHRTLAPFLYQGGVAFLVKRCKFRGERHVCRYLSQIMAKAVAQENFAEKPQALVPVPLSRQRIVERGFNQAVDIAIGLSLQTGIPCIRIAERTKSTAAQSTLATTRERRRNVADAFRITTRTGLSHVAVIDDVFTTGATSESLARALHASGIATIDRWIFARTP